MTYPRKTLFALAVAFAAATLTACVPTTPTVLPDVVVEQPGSAELDGNEFVVALRASQTARALAWNSGDFSIASLSESTAAVDIDFDYDYYFAHTFRDWDPLVYAGPPSWAPISVESTATGAVITACSASQDRKITKEDLDTKVDLTTGRIISWTIEVDGDGRVVIDDYAGTEDECDPSAAEVLTFDPEPTLPEKITEGDIREPADE